MSGCFAAVHCQTRPEGKSQSQRSLHVNMKYSDLIHAQYLDSNTCSDRQTYEHAQHFCRCILSIWQILFSTRLVHASIVLGR